MATPLEAALRKLDFQYRRSIKATPIQQLPWELQLHDPLSVVFHEALKTPSSTRENSKYAQSTISDLGKKFEC
jgi:hypothetical protein